MIQINAHIKGLQLLSSCSRNVFDLMAEPYAVRPTGTAHRKALSGVVYNDMEWQVFRCHD